MRVLRTSEQARNSPSARRSPMLVAAGVLLVAAGALTSAGIYTNLSHSQTVIAIIAPVARGQQIARADLTTVQVGFDPILKPVPASEIAAVAGQYATKDLAAGSFLTPQSYGKPLSPGSGEAEVGVALTAGKYPDNGLRPGDKVQLVALPEAGSSELPTGGTFGTIATATSSGGTLLASIIVNSSEAPQVAALSASNKLALVLVSRG